MYWLLVIGCLFCTQGTQARIANFNLFTPGRTSPEKISPANLGSTFNPAQKLAFIIHGYIDNAHNHRFVTMRKELMKKDKRNVIVVDWSRGSTALYPTAVQNTRVVGNEIAALVKRLHRRHNYTLSKIHVIGHSLGAHVAGFAGAKIQTVLAGKKLGRITGLDPARPLFDHNNKHERLDNNDAKFVDVIHTDAGALGLTRPCGHVDFYPNGGKHQPGCSSTGFLSFGVRAFKMAIPYSQNDICDHLLVLDFFTASINNNKCSRKSFPCTNWQSFKNGSCTKCNGTCAEMGYNADQHHRGKIIKSTHKFYLKLSSTYPYCAPRYSYYVTLHSVTGSSSSLFNSDEIKIQLHGKNADSIPINLSDVKTSTVSHVVVSNTKLHPLRDISISYKGSTASAKLYVGKVTVIGPQFKYRAVYNTRLLTGSLSYFFMTTTTFKTYKKPLRRII